MSTGEYGNVDVPKKAIQAVDVVYQASTLVGAVGNTIPTEPYDELLYKFDVTKGVPGEYDVQPDGDIDLKKLAVTQLSANMVWSMYKFMITDNSKLYARNGPQRTWDNAVKSATEYFSAIKDYQCVSTMVSGAASNHAALGGVWSGATAQIENDIIKGLQYISTNSNVQNGDVISTLVPVNVYHELMKLDLIGNVQQQLKEYMQRSFELSIRPFRPYRNSAGTAILDGLSTSCLMYVNGPNTARHAQYSTQAASVANFPLTERWRVEGRGDAYYQRMASVARVVWDGVQSTDTTSNRIYKITGVTS